VGVARGDQRPRPVFEHRTGPDPDPL